MRQAKKILEKFDEVLYGSSPETLVKDAHKKIRELLGSDTARTLFREEGGGP